MYIQFQSANLMLAATTVQFPACPSVNHCLELFESHRSQKTWQSLNRGQMGQEGQIRGRVKFTNLPPTSKLDRLSLSFGGGRRGRRGRFFKNFFRRVRKQRRPYPDTRACSAPSSNGVARLDGADPKWQGRVRAETSECKTVESVMIYTYFYNPRFPQRTQSAEGWGATTIYDLTNQG